jgi:hypothetical protein
MGRRRIENSVLLSRHHPDGDPFNNHSSRTGTRDRNNNSERTLDHSMAEANLRIQL